MRPVNGARIIKRALDKIAGLIEAKFVRDRLSGLKMLDQFGFELFAMFRHSASRCHCVAPEEVEALASEM